MVGVRFGFQSITGNFRSNNEDRCLVDPAGRFFLVADGMGGQSAGEKASELAIDIISKQLSRCLDFEKDAPDRVVKCIDDSIVSANSEIMALGEIEPAFHNMGTTISFLVQVAGKFFVGGVGDSRAYQLRGKKLEQLTVDHSLTQALRDAGTISEKEAATHRYKNVLYRYLGTKEGSSGTEPKKIAPKSGDRFLLCSDGVTDGVPDAMLKQLLAEHDDPQAAAEKIVDAAQQGGSKDNITCVVVFVD
ncbi:MAG TPA: protein phosphatase 2C domain-containing protein [Planctomycetaceae bacterium]|nr:protein phosphatase 2C domain-containing protein [Planctomycetaceae bacterium]